MKYLVSVHVVGFAFVEVEAKSKEEAEEKAMKAHHSELEIQQYTLQQQVVEKVEEVA